MKIAIAGAGIYGATAAIRLAENGYQVHLFDPLGVMRAASAINQYRIHSGYHYPRSSETIREIQAARQDFMHAFGPAVVRNSHNYYAIPHCESRTSRSRYEQVMAEHGLPLSPCRPDWLNYDFIDACYEVNEHVYDPDVLRSLIVERLSLARVQFEQCAFTREMRADYDFVVWATYGMGPSRGIFSKAKYQVAEKMLVQLPDALHHVALVIVDGPFTGFDPHGSSQQSLFGSAKNTNRWSSTDPNEPVPEPYASQLNGEHFAPVPFTNFEAMREDAARAVPATAAAVYLGSRFVMRVVEDNPEQDRRVLYVIDGEPGELHLFSGKVVSAVKAARLVHERIAQYG
jgi:D-amino-acid oxidase